MSANASSTTDLQQLRSTGGGSSASSIKGVRSKAIPFNNSQGVINGLGDEKENALPKVN